MGIRTISLVLTGVILSLGCSRQGDPPSASKPSWIGACSTKLTADVLKESVRLGAAFIINNQLPPGNFEYEYDWKSKQLSKDDNQVRQAGALWGLALLYLSKPSKELEQATIRGFDFFEKFSKVTSNDERYVVYPGDSSGKTGTVALVALAYLDFLRAAAATLPASEMARQRKVKDQYLNMLVKLRRDDGLWYGGYSHENGNPMGAPSPYSDGEALLALAKAARFYARTDFKDIILKSAETGIRINVNKALASHPDSPITKGYYQWGSMALFEINQLGWDSDGKFALEVIRLADWMIDVHKTLSRTKNTAYAYEGIVHAYKLALTRDTEKAKKLGCVIEKGLEKLTSWQVGHSIANEFIKAEKTTDVKAIGGVQNSADESPLRIDVVQHQMHAVNLALQFYYGVN